MLEGSRIIACKIYIERYSKSKWLSQVYVSILLSDKYCFLHVLNQSITSCVSFPLTRLFLMLLLQMHSVLALVMLVSTAYGRQEVVFSDSQNVYPRVVTHQKSADSIKFPGSSILPRHRDRHPGQSLGQYLGITSTGWLVGEVLDWGLGEGSTFQGL